MSGKHSDALRQRWADPAYRERQTEVIHRAAKLPRVLSKRKSKMTTDAIKDARIAELERACERLRADLDTLYAGGRWRRGMDEGTQEKSDELYSM